MTGRQLTLLAGANVDNARRKSGMSVLALANRAGLAQTPVQKLCTGQSQQVSLHTVVRLAEVLDVSVDCLVGRG